MTFQGVTDPSQGNGTTIDSVLQAVTAVKIKNHP